jgi:hypothetical protein
VAVRQLPYPGSVLHRASTREPRADLRWEEVAESDAEADRRTKLFERSSPPRRTEGDADSESSGKHGQCVSASQKPDATRIAGFYAWKQLGRRVKKGEHGIRILAPMIGVRRKKDEEAEKDIRTQNRAVLVGFRAAYVFDVSQTEGNPLPEFSERVSGNAGEYRDRLVDFVIGQGIELEFKESIAPALGMSYGGKIALLPGQSSAEGFSTLVHELAHLCSVENYVV